MNMFGQINRNYDRNGNFITKNKRWCNGKTKPMLGFMP